MYVYIIIVERGRERGGVYLMMLLCMYIYDEIRSDYNYVIYCYEYKVIRNR